MTLAEFLTARLDEDEAAAKQSAALFTCFEAKPGDWTRLMCDPVMGPFGGQSSARDVVTGMYVGKMSDPARALREAEAKRAILAMWQEPEPDRYLATGEIVAQVAVSGAIGRVVRELAAVWRDHPDYDETWED
jgi:hypothetical protein